MKNLIIILILGLSIKSYSQWTQISVPTTSGLNNAFFVDENIGYIVGGGDFAAPLDCQQLVDAWTDPDDTVAGNEGYWLMDPFTEDASNSGKLYFNLGDISEDILRDSRKSYEKAPEKEVLRPSKSLFSYRKGYKNQEIHRLVQIHKPLQECMRN